VSVLLSKFKLEEYFALHEFSVPLTMTSSDPESLLLSDLVAMADEEMLIKWKNLYLGYTEAAGSTLLREEISALYDAQSRDNIVVFSGAEEAIYITLKSLLKSNDQVVLLTPCYQSLKEIPKATGAIVTEMPLEWVDNNWIFDLNKFSRLVTKQTKLVILNFPHNPTGFHPDKTLFKNIIDIVKQNDSYLFCDEVYRLSEQDPDNTLPNAVDCYEKAISLGVMSKSFGLAGLRIGWIAAQNKHLLNDLISFKNYTSISNSSPSEILSIIALRNKEAILQRNREISRNNLDLLDVFFKEYSSIYDWYRPNAGFINFPRLKIDVSIDEFTDNLRKEEGVLLLPGTLFDNEYNHFRLGFGRKNLPEALSRLEKFTISRLCRS
jgi:aspartate/methionine/tyrosine aminotransferase